MPSMRLNVKPIPPFRLDLTVWVLKRRPHYVVDDWDGTTHRRILRLGADLAGVEIRQDGPPESATLEVAVSSSGDAIAQTATVVDEVERLLGTSVDLAGFYSLAESDHRLRLLADRFMGVKPPRYPTMFECLTNAITCQLVSLDAGLSVVARLVERYGERIADAAFPPAFPAPATIAGADPDDLRQLGYSRQKARALIDLAQGIESGAIDFGPLEQLDDDTAVKRLTALRGIGRWTAEYALLRGLGRLHVFPGDDVGARNTLQRWVEADAPLSYDGVRQTLASWDAYGGLLYFHMLLLGLESKGRLGTLA